MTSSTFVTNFSIADYSAVTGQTVGYVGFTGGDGGSVSIQQVSNFTFVPAAPPVLSLSNSALSWSGGVLTNMVLQQSTQLTGPWTNSAATPTLHDDNNQVGITPANGMLFYRLAAP